MKTKELSGKQLDWAVKQAIKKDGGYFLPSKKYKDISHAYDWSYGGPLIERERIGVKYTGTGMGCVAWKNGTLSTEHDAYGPTPLVAAMRCYVASKLGEEVEIPNELLTTQGE